MVTSQCICLGSMHILKVTTGSMKASKTEFQYLAELGLQFSVLVKHTTSVVQVTTASLRNGPSHDGDFLLPCNLSQHGRGWRCFQSSINVFCIGWEAVIRVWTVPHLLITYQAQKFITHENAEYSTYMVRMEEIALHKGLVCTGFYLKFC